ncbi:MAG TPA: glycosyltransferase family 9 protein, partial [Gemmatimonadaceae bacterium]|nr:glycosyltransferase family 9 protein [Gemmatimonadaceae bacterium]
MRKSRPLKRRIHTAFHHSMMRLLTRLLKRTRESDLQKLSSNLPLRSLFIRYERIGDLLMATPAIRAIAESREGSTVDVLASPANAAVVEGNPRVRRIVLFSRPAWSTYPALWWRLRRARYDVVIDGRVNPQRITGITPLLLLMTGARIRIGAAIEGKESLYTHRVPVDRYAHFARQTLSLARPFGVDVDAVDLRPEIYVTSAECARAKGLWAKLVSDDASPRLIVNISAVGPLRQWPDERYAYVVRGFLGRYPNATVVIVATPSEAN